MAALIYILALLALLNLFKVLRRMGELPRVGRGAYGVGVPPLVSVIVPMRNEERNVVRCMESLLDQDYERYEVIAVDDASEDKTLELLRGYEVNHDCVGVIALHEKPYGWVGKNHALAAGAKEARGDLLLFVDADTCAERFMLSSTVAYLEKSRLDMLSLFPYQELVTFWEKVVQPLVFGVIQIAYPCERVNSTAFSDALACGQFILVRKEAYLIAGGHETIKDRIVEDLELARSLKEKGFKIGIADGGEVLKTRMYTSLGELWEGWAKNLYPGMGCRLSLAARLVLSIACLSIAPPIVFPVALYSFCLTPGTDNLSLSLLSLFLIAANLLFYSKQVLRMHVPLRYVLLFPLSAAVFVACLTFSVYRVLTGKGVVWKGRVYRQV